MEPRLHPDIERVSVAVMLYTRVLNVLRGIGCIDSGISCFSSVHYHSLPDPFQFIIILYYLSTPCSLAADSVLTWHMKTVLICRKN
jgi:hypothetical protein